MRTPVIAICVALPACIAILGSTPLVAQTDPPVQAAAAGSVAFAQEAAMRAVNFKEGDAEALNRARADFTPEAWAVFIKWMGEYVDQKGAPKFTSSFVPSAKAVVVSQDNGTVHLRIPGTLRQSQAHGVTTYRAGIDVEAGGTPLKIRHLEVATCGGVATAGPTPCG